MLQETFELIEKIDYKIQTGRTGPAGTLAQSVGISPRTLHNYLAMMRDLGAPIYFNKVKKSYCYREEGSFTIAFLSDKERQQHDEPRPDKSDSKKGVIRLLKKR
jgi:transcriptional antiterminator